MTDELLPNAPRWYAGLCEREPFRTHVMLPFDELNGRIAY